MTNDTQADQNLCGAVALLVGWNIGHVQPPCLDAMIVHVADSQEQGAMSNKSIWLRLQFSSNFNC